MEPHEQDTRDCLAIEDNMGALACLKKTVAKYAGSDVCKPKLVLLVQDGCVPCKEQIAKHKEDIEKGIITKVNISTVEGIAIAKRNNIEFIPFLLLLDCHDDLIERD